MKRFAAMAALSVALSANTVWAQDDDEAMLVPIKRMSLETALTVAQASIEACREEGVQVAVTVVDRGGHAQVVLRDVLTPDVALSISKSKAYTAMAFNVATSQMQDRARSPIAYIDGLAFFAGGVPIQAGGELVGAVGVSGAPSGETDEKCAQAGVDAVSDDLEMAADE